MLELSYNEATGVNQVRERGGSREALNEGKGKIVCSDPIVGGNLEYPGTKENLNGLNRNEKKNS